MKKQIKKIIVYLILVSLIIDAKTLDMCKTVYASQVSNVQNNIYNNEATDSDVLDNNEIIIGDDNGNEATDSDVSYDGTTDGEASNNENINMSTDSNADHNSGEEGGSQTGDSGYEDEPEEDISTESEAERNNGGENEEDGDDEENVEYGGENVATNSDTSGNNEGNNIITNNYDGGNDNNISSPSNIEENIQIPDQNANDDLEWGAVGTLPSDMHIGMSVKRKLFRAEPPLPTRYDAREVMNASGHPIVPPIRNQGREGLCWAFSTLNMFEASARSQNLIPEGTSDQQYEANSNFAELVLGYFMYHLKDFADNYPEYLDKPGYQGNDYSDKLTDTDAVFTGGRQDRALFMMSAYVGATVEDGTTAYTTQNLNIVSNENYLDPIYAYQSNDYVLKNAYFINKDDIQAIKKKVMQNGSVGISYFAASEEQNFHNYGEGDNWEQCYYSGGGTINHGVAIVGWDDNIPKECFYWGSGDYEDGITEVTRDGAWLIRNSWGPSRHKDGYFWMSYEEPSIEEVVYAVDAMKANTYEYNYHYDTTGCTYDESRYQKIGNIYKVSGGNQKLEAVSVGIACPGSTATIKIYTKDSEMDDPEDGDLISILSNKYFEIGGIYTLELNQPLEMRDGTYFSVVVEGKGPGNDNISYYYEITQRNFQGRITENSDTEDNQSFGCEDGGWYPNSITDRLFRIKALANPIEGKICVSYNLNDDTAMQNVFITPGSKINEPDTPERLSYDFKGWFLDNNTFENEWDFENDVVTEDIILYAKWERTGYVVHFANSDLDDIQVSLGSKLSSDGIIGYDDPISHLYISGLAKDSDFYDRWDFDNDVVNDDITLYPIYEYYKYNIKYNAEGSDIHNLTDIKTYETKIVLRTPTRSDKTFDGWYKSQSCEEGDEYLGDTDFENVTNNCTVNIYAKWVNPSYIIEYNQNYDDGWSDGVVCTQKVETGVTSTQLIDSPFTSEGISRYGYLFLGWTEDQEGNGNVYENNATFTKEGATKDQIVKLYAKWEPVNYHYILDPNGGTCETGILNKTFGVDVELPIPTNGNKKFVGWFTDYSQPWEMLYDGTIDIYFDNGEACTLAAKWADHTYKVKYNKNSNDVVEGTMPDQIMPYGATQYLKYNEYYRQGYLFRFWMTDTEPQEVYYDHDYLNEIYDGDDSYVKELYAFWEPIEYSLALRYRGGEVEGGNVEFITKTYGQNLESPLPTPSKPGKRFGGWYTDFDCHDKYEGDRDLTTTEYTYVNLYAKWDDDIEGIYNISYDEKGGAFVEGYTPPTTWTSGDGEITLPDATKIKKDHYTFLGWYEGNNKIEKISRSRNTNASLVAKWEGEKYKISFGEGQGDLKLYVQYDGNIYTDDAYTNPIDVSLMQLSLSLAGYKFLGYFSEENGQGTKYVDEDGYFLDTFHNKAFTEDTILYDAWEQLVTVHTITLNKNYDGSTSDTIYEKYGDGIYKEYNPSTKIVNGKITDSNPVTVPSRAGYEFLGYFDGVGDAAVKYIDKDGKLTTNFTNTKFNADTTLYAKWEPITYIINYDANGGSVNPTSFTKTYNTNKDLATPTKEGYDFVAWYKENTFENKYDGKSDLSTTKNDNKTIYAKWEPITYTINYNANGGSVNPTSFTKTYNTNKDLAIPTKEGYDFVAWYKENTFENEYDGKSDLSTTKNDNKTIYAKWDGKVYNITLNNNGGSENTTIYEKYAGGIYKTYNSTTKEISDKIEGATVVNVPTKTGHTFLGYYENQDGSGTQYIDKDGKLTTNFTNTKFTNNTTLYAKWEANIYVITIDKNGGDADIVLYEKYGDGIYRNYNPTTKEVSSKIGEFDTIEVPTRANYTFIGCYASISGPGLQYVRKEGTLGTNFKSTKFTQDTTLYARWDPKVYKITLNMNYEGASDDIIYEKYDNGIYKSYNSLNGSMSDKIDDLNPVDIPSRTGYTFLGYFENQDGTGAQYIDSDGYLTASFTNTIFTDDATLYAKWDGNVYTITLDKNGGDEDLIIYEKYGDGIYRNYNSATKEISNKIGSTEIVNIPTREGYNFLGYFENQDGSGTQYINNQGKFTTSFTNTKFTNNINLYAKWTELEIYTITLKHNNDEDDMLLYERYSDGIYKTINGSTLSDKITSATIVKKPTKAGYTFLGYFENQNGTGTQYINKDGKLTANFTNTTFTDSKSIYAKWEAITYTITYDANGGSVTPQSFTKTYGSDAQLKTPTKANYEFINWYKENTFENPYDGKSDLTTTKDDNKTIYARWDGKVYNITLNNNGGSTDTIIYEKYNDGIYKNYDASTKEVSNKIEGSTTVPIPTKANYTFLGYYQNQNGTGTQYIDKDGQLTADFIITKFSANTTLYAKWEGIVYNITLNKNYDGSTSDTIYEKYGDGIYKTYNATTKELSGKITNTNPVTIPTKANHTFLGYYENQDGTGTQYIDKNGKLTSSFTNIKFTNNTTTLYAKWDGIVYTITLNNNGGSTNTTIYEKYGDAIYKTYDSNTKAVNGKITDTNPVTIPTKANYTFLGYYENQDGTGLQLINNQGKLTANFTNTKFTNNITLYAKWEPKVYNITLNNNGGSTDTTIYEKYADGIYKNYDDNTKVVSNKIEGQTTVPIPTKANYTFLGYYQNQNGTGTQYIDKDGKLTTNFTNIKFTNNTTLYAKWDGIIYNITLNRNYEGSTNDIIYEKYGDAIYKTYNAVTKELSGKITNTVKVTVPSRAGYTFLGYYENQNGTGTQLINNQGSLTADFTNTKFTALTILYAKWEANSYTITYVANGGTVSPQSFTKIYDEDASLATPTREGYDFVAWYKEAALTNSYDGKSDLTTSKNANKNIYAKWDGKVYTITLNKNGGNTDYTIYEKYADGIYKTYNSTTKEVNNKIDNSNPITIPTRTGYNFLGYYENQDGSGTQYIDNQGKITASFINTKFTNNINLYAKWDEIVIGVHTITLKNGTSEDKLIYVKEGEGIYNNKNGSTLSGEIISSTVISKPSKINYNFLGYYKNQDGSGDQYIDSNGKLTSKFTNTTFTEDTILYAKWQAKPQQPSNPGGSGSSNNGSTRGGGSGGGGGGGGGGGAGSALGMSTTPGGPGAMPGGNPTTPGTMPTPGANMPGGQNGANNNVSQNIQDAVRNTIDNSIKMLSLRNIPVSAVTLTEDAISIYEKCMEVTNANNVNNISNNNTKDERAIILTINALLNLDVSQRATARNANAKPPILQFINNPAFVNIILDKSSDYTVPNVNDTSRIKKQSDFRPEKDQFGNIILKDINNNPITGFQYFNTTGSNDLYYINDSGQITCGIVKDALGNIYYFQDNGQMTKNTDLNIDGQLCHIDNEGKISNDTNNTDFIKPGVDLAQKLTEFIIQMMTIAVAS